MDLPALQTENELAYSQKHLNDAVEEAILEDPIMADKVWDGEVLLQAWLEGDYYKQKNARLAQLDPLSLSEIVMDVFVSVAYCRVPELFVSLTSRLAVKMGFDSHRDSIITIAEIVAVLCETDAYDITKEDARSSLMIVSRLNLPDPLLEKIDQAMYVPPMVCKPLSVESNYESAYLTFNDSLILGSDNGHNEDICLDVINTQNAVALQLCIPFLESVPEEATYALDTIEKQTQWKTFRAQSNDIYQMLHNAGNTFYLTNKEDKRGRMYAQGYHVTTQGSPFKKASIELAHEERVKGVPA